MQRTDTFDRVHGMPSAHSAHQTHTNRLSHLSVANERLCEGSGGREKNTFVSSYARRVDRLLYLAERRQWLKHEVGVGVIEERQGLSCCTPIHVYAMPRAGNPAIRQHLEGLTEHYDERA